MCKSSTKKSDASKIYTWAEVKKHATADDAWVVFNNKVYDVSDWYEHPGGAVIFTHAGDDMTDIFAAMHAAGSHAAMKQFLIGELDPTTVTHKDQRNWDFERGYRKLRAELVKMGMFRSNGYYYAWKCVSNLMIWALACAMVAYFDSAAVHFASAVIMGLFWQQCGWLAHDFLHHQVFHKRSHGDLLGLFWGNLAQGYSMQWWKNKHNGHHAVPNLHNSTPFTTDGDPDIDTMPLLAWSLKQARSLRECSPDGKDTAVTKFFIRYQAILYFPILLLARLSWLNESAKTAFGISASSENARIEWERKGLQYPMLEKVGIVVHHAWVFAVSTGFGRFSFLYSMWYFLTATCGCGFLLALVFGLGHNGMAVYDADKRPDFWKLQVTTTRNITGGHGFPQFFVDWFCGGLQYQVEHHLFPMMPRHNLAKAHTLVVSFCKEWGVTYHEADLVDGTIEVLKHLKDVSNSFIEELIEEFPAM